MRASASPCQNTAVFTRVTAAFLSCLLALGPGAALAKAPAKTSLLVLPLAPMPGVPEQAAQRATEVLTQEMKGRGELKLQELKAAPAAKAVDAGAQARAALARAIEQGRKGKHAQAAEALQKAIALLMSHPLSLDEEGGKLLSDAAVQLAVERLLAGDEDAGDAALALLVRVAPEREVPAADYPPAFVRELEGVRKRLFASPRGALRVLAPPGPGAARVLLDGRALGNTPLLIKDALPGEHALRVERDGKAWARTAVVIAGVETPLAPLPGDEGPAAELTSALLSGEVDRPALATAARLAKAAGAQASVLGALVPAPGGYSLKTFLAQGDKAYALPVLELDKELLGALVGMVKVGDEVQAKLLSPGAEASLPVSLGAAAASEAASVQGAPAPEVEVPLAPLALAPLVPAAQAPAAQGAAEAAPRSLAAPEPAPAEPPSRRVAVPGAPVAAAPAPGPAQSEPLVAAAAPRKPADEPPSRALVVPRMPTEEAPESAPVSSSKPRVAPLSAAPAQAVEPDAIRTIREPAPSKNHTALWIITGIVLATAAGAGGYFLWQSNQTPSTAQVNASWSK